MKGPLRIPAEWERHECCWLAFPHAAVEWPHNLDAAQRSVATLCRTIAHNGNEPVRVLVNDGKTESLARNLIGSSPTIDYVRAQYGDCWVRDTLPLLGLQGSGELGALVFGFNGWGEKFRIPGDDAIGLWLAQTLGAGRFVCDAVLEGGALEFNGQGACITTRSCVLNSNRNPGLDAESFEAMLSSLVEIDRLVWLERGLSNDHTDGHVDMIARFVSADTVVCTVDPSGGPDETLGAEIERDLLGEGLTVRRLPSSGPVSAPDGSALAANYCNFYVANEAVIVPQYGVAGDADACALLAEAFSDREVVGQDARDLLWGGGALHCITQPQPFVE